eukprot:CAMPEP_0194428510 /NCGR_PEP_ID=MMETSP0176-20130528/41412_1 /TAXON_ID=216777 /ORGANISM="Proboscia alata, Strain PI-D3" /LENGTH=111 /DNA_ID=CAMNT_0039240923 /DNA_START=92 /DNA_END=427 /DNA_ORIENTATION=-
MIRRMGLPDMLTDGYEGHIDGGYDPNQGGPEGGYDPNQPGGPGAPGGHNPNQQGGPSSGGQEDYPSYDPNQQGGEAGCSSTDNGAGVMIAPTSIHSTRLRTTATHNKMLDT